MAVRFCPIASGSSGNCIYIGTDSTNILIDAGVSGKRIEQGLDAIGVSGHDIDALFITHEHSDHVQSAGVMSRRYNIPVFATYNTWLALNKAGVLGKLNPKNKLLVNENEKLFVNEVTVTPFKIPHDAAQPVGYTFSAGERKISLATDFGIPTDEIKESIVDSDILLLESNHDVDMLRNGPYPLRLQQRIMANTGHISNVAAGLLIAEIFTEKLKYVYLAHLSEENNKPDIAYETVTTILANYEIELQRDLQLMLADRHCVSKLIEL